MSSELKVDTISEKTSGNGIALSSSLKLKQYTSSQIDALTGMSDGEMVYDTDEKDIRVYNSATSDWTSVTSTGSWTATGGTETTEGNDTIHTFTTSGSFIVSGGRGYF